MEKKIKTIPAITKQTRLNKHREIRDVYNKLRRKYKLEIVYQFFRQNYFLQPNSIDHIIANIDREPVSSEQASIAYNIAMNSDFHL